MKHQEKRNHLCTIFLWKNPEQLDSLNSRDERKPLSTEAKLRLFWNLSISYHGFVCLRNHFHYVKFFFKVRFHFRLFKSLFLHYTKSAIDKLFLQRTQWQIFHAFGLNNYSPLLSYEESCHGQAGCG